MFKKLTALSMVVVMSLCPLAKSSCAANDDELTAKIAAILTETGSENQQNLELSGDKVQDAKKVQKILKEIQAKEKALQDKKKAERNQKLIKYWNIIREALQFSATLIVNGFFLYVVVDKFR